MGLFTPIQSLLSLANIWSQNQIFNGSNNTAPNQYTTASNGLLVPSSSSSLMTKNLVQAQYTEMLMNSYWANWSTTANGTGSSVNTTLATTNGLNNKYGFSLGATSGTWASVELSVRPAGYYGGNLTHPFSYYYCQAFALNSLGTSDILSFGMYNPSDITRCPISSPWLVSSANGSIDSRWVVQVQPVSTTAIQARLLTMSQTGALTTGSWVSIAMSSQAGQYQTRFNLIVQKIDNNTLNAYVGSSSGTTYQSQYTTLTNMVLIGSSTTMNFQSSNIGINKISCCAVNGGGVASTSEVETPKIILT